MHTIIPAILNYKDQLTIPFGVMGGAYQPNGHMRFMSNFVDFNMNIQEAIDGPRSFFENGNLMLERGYDKKVRAGLLDMGHNIKTPTSPIGGGQAIKIDWKNGFLEGGSDPRKDGCAIGY
jgi:gamma-glutamyltranspeptidase/glutathione hydrolase